MNASLRPLIYHAILSFSQARLHMMRTQGIAYLLDRCHVTANGLVFLSIVIARAFPCFPCIRSQRGVLSQYNRPIMASYYLRYGI